MKVIGAKSLVHITSNMSEVGSRPSPGVYDFDHASSGLLLLSIDYPTAVLGKITSVSGGVIDVLGNSVGTVYEPDPNKAWGLGALWAIRFVYVDQNNQENSFNITKTGRVTTDNIVNGWLLSSNIDAGNMQNGTLTCTFVLSFDEETPEQTIENLYKFVGGKSIGAPSWYGEDSPFGDGLAYFGQPKSVEIAISNQISCEGAIDSVLFFDAVLPDTNPPPDTTYLKVDDVLIGDTDPFPEWLEIQFLNGQQPDPTQIPEGFVADGENGNLRRWINNDTVPHRIEMGSNDPSLVREIMYGNDTVIELTDIKGESSGVCLSAKSNQISCAGATSSCELKNDPDHTAFMSISEIILNGVSYPRREDFFGGFDFPENTIQIKEVRVEEPREYYIEVKNLSDEFMRIELIGYPDREASSGNTNPTLDFVDGPKAIACLAPISAS